MEQFLWRFLTCQVAFIINQVASWGQIYEKLQAIYDEMGLKYVVDSAFCAGIYIFVVKLGQDWYTANPGLRTHQEQLHNIAVKKQATIMHQLAEWGMRAMESLFPRLKTS